MDEAPAFQPLARAHLALTLLAIDPGRLGGICLRGRAGHLRDWLDAHLVALPQPLVRVSPSASDGQLFGELDLGATLASGHVQHRDGLLACARTLRLPGAERIGAGMAGRLAGAMDLGMLCVIAEDEGVEDERLPAGLAERLAFHVDLDGIPLAEVEALTHDSAAILDARACLPDVAVPDEHAAQLATMAAALGIPSLRAEGFALAAARAHAALNGRAAVEMPDMAAAADLTLAHRATVLPEFAEEPDQPDPPEPEPEPETGEDRHGGDAIPDDILLDAVRAALPAGLLDRLAKGTGARNASGSGSGSGIRRKSNRRGRPLPSRQGRPDAAARLDIVATLRAAVPWQKTRRRKPGGPVQIRPSDFRIRRYEDLSDRLLIFTVDASGSAAIARLAEAKGAIELLLGDAYARRDHVALISFRGSAAEILLPPTRSLVQTKRRLAALPGGGGTPLAGGLEAALRLALTSRARGLTPVIVLLTDGRANIALDGQPDRARATEDAQTIARAIPAQGIETLVIDTGLRPGPALAELSGLLRGTYLPMPRADSRRLSQAVTQTLDA